MARKMEKKKIVILGAGFGGLRSAIIITQTLRSLDLLVKYEIILIDRNEHHTYTPLLYEVATTSKETADLRKLHQITAYNLKELLSSLTITIIQNEITNLSPETGKITLAKNKEISCDYLILALGSETNYFNIPGLKENAFPLKTFVDAVRIRDTIWDFLLEGQEKINIVIGGGGSTGVELSSELKMWCGELGDDFPRCTLNVFLIEAAPTILPGFTSQAVSIVKKRLKKLGVQILENETIAQVQSRKVISKTGKEINFDILIWTGGVKAPTILSKLSFKRESHGRIEVAEEMECLPQSPNLKLAAKIYGIGDSVCFYDPRSGKPIPGVARAAISQAEIAAQNIIEDIKLENSISKKTNYKTYKPADYPYVIPVGGKFAIAKIGPFLIYGFFGWIFKGLVELNYLISIMPLEQALLTWLKGLRIFIQNDRLG